MSNLERDIEELEEAASSEYERQRVPQKALKGPSAFWGMYAGEHTAGTEFMIGPLFVAYGVGAGDLILGLLLGNLAAVNNVGTSMQIRPNPSAGINGRG